MDCPHHARQPRLRTLMSWAFNRASTAAYWRGSAPKMVYTVRLNTTRSKLPFVVGLAFGQQPVVLAGSDPLGPGLTLDLVRAVFGSDQVRGGVDQTVRHGWAVPGSLDHDRAVCGGLDSVLVGSVVVDGAVAQGTQGQLPVVAGRA